MTRRRLCTFALVVALLSIAFVLIGGTAYPAPLRDVAISEIAWMGTTTSTPTHAPASTNTSTPTLTRESVIDPTNSPSQFAIIVDNTDPGFSTTTQDVWQEYYKEGGQHWGDSHYFNRIIGTGQDTAHWQFRVPRPGQYEVYAHWWALDFRPIDVPYTINHAQGSTPVRVNQRINGGQWNLLGTFYFTDQGSVMVSDDVSPIGGEEVRDIVADAIRLVYTEPPWDEIVIDDTDPGFSTTIQDVWQEYYSEEGQHWGDSHYYNRIIGAGQDTAHWQFRVPQPGQYEVYAYWWDYPFRPIDVPYTINHAQGRALVRVNQRINGGQWNLLGTFYFNDQGSVMVSDDVSPIGGEEVRDIVADAIHLVHVPPAPTLTLIKNVINNNGGDAGENDFGLSVGGSPVNSGDVSTLMANTPYAIDEVGLAGYTFVSITGDAKCPAVLGGTVTLDEGEDVTCTITNDDDAPTATPTQSSTVIYLPMVLKSFIHYAPPCSASNNYCEDYDTPQTAYGPLEPGVAYTAYPEDEKDYYCFLASDSASPTVRLTDYWAVGWLIVRAEDLTIVGSDVEDPISDGVLEVDLSNLSPGMYYIQVYTSSGHHQNNLYTLNFSH